MSLAVVLRSKQFERKIGNARGLRLKNLIIFILVLVLVSPIWLALCQSAASASGCGVIALAWPRVYSVGICVAARQ